MQRVQELHQQRQLQQQREQEEQQEVQEEEPRVRYNSASNVFIVLFCSALLRISPLLYLPSALRPLCSISPLLYLPSTRPPLYSTSPLLYSTSHLLYLPSALPPLCSTSALPPLCSTCVPPLYSIIFSIFSQNSRRSSGRTGGAKSIGPVADSAQLSRSIPQSSSETSGGGAPGCAGARRR